MNRRSRGSISFLTLIATIIAVVAGPSLGALAATSTVPSVVDYSQCANGAPPSTSLACPSGWVNGILQGSNSHYHGTQVTPQRAIVSGHAPGSARNHSHTLTFTAVT